MPATVHILPTFILFSFIPLASDTEKASIASPMPNIALTIKNSKFICQIIQVNSKEEIIKNLNDAKQLYPNATHYCYAYILDNIKLESDDDEPSGTAGIPILQVLEKNELNHVLCIVVRYFGGIKLGAGGLVRAYSSSASGALKEAGIAPIINYSELLLIFSYGYMNIIENKLKNYEVLSKEFTTNVSLTIKLPTTEVQELKDILISLTNNQIIINEK